MTTYNTGNPVGSADPKDLFDNAENLDHWINDRTVDTWMDRLGVERWTWFGMEQAFEESQGTRFSLFNAEQEDRETRFQSQLNGMGYVPIGDYDDGPLTITERTEIFTKDGNWWRSSAALELPYTTIENWATDEANFVNIGEATLRSELAATGGVEMVGDALDKRQDLADINNPVEARANLGVVDVPAPGEGDAGKAPVVNGDEDGYIPGPRLPIPSPGMKRRILYVNASGDGFSTSDDYVLESTSVSLTGVGDFTNGVISLRKVGNVIHAALIDVQHSPAGNASSYPDTPIPEGWRTSAERFDYVVYQFTDGVIAQLMIYGDGTVSISYRDADGEAASKGGLYGACVSYF